jgi:hypothetical protein
MAVLLKEMLLFIIGRIRPEVDFRLGRKEPGNWLLIIGGVLVVVSMQFPRMSMMLILLPMLMVYLYEPFFRTRLVGDTTIAMLPYRPEQLLAGCASAHYRRIARDSLILLALVLAWFFFPLLREAWRDFRTGGTADPYMLKLWGSLVLVFALGSFWAVLVVFATTTTLLLAGGVRPIYSLLGGVLLVYGMALAMNLACVPLEKAEEEFARDDLVDLPDTFLAEKRPWSERLGIFYFLEVGRGTFTSGSGRWIIWLALLLASSLAASLVGQGAAHWLFRERLLE